MFSLHPTLQKDAFLIADLLLSRLLLMNNCNFPWLILVPRRPDIKEITDLSLDDRKILMDEICIVSEKMTALFSPDKMNVGALGNIVPQLHIHVIARYVGDPAWPAPVWGAHSKPYDEISRENMLAKLKRATFESPQF